MKRIFWILITILFLIIVGCQSQKNQLINELKPAVEDRYSVLAFKGEQTPSEDFQSAINETFHDPEVWENKLYSFEILDRIPKEPYDYAELLAIEERPEFLVFDTKGLAFRTNDLRELESFMLEH